MKAFIVCAGLVSGVLALSAIAWTGTPIRALIEGCQGDTYFDDVDKVCVKGGTVEIMNGRTQWEILDISWRRGPELMTIRGVTGVSVDRHGLRVEVDPDHDPIPATMEGAPIHVMPARHSVLVGADLAPPQ